MTSVEAPDKRAAEYERVIRIRDRRTQMAKSLLVAVVAEGQAQNYPLRRKCAEALRLGYDDMSAGVTSHAMGGRLDLGGSPYLAPTAGCYPMTEYEHRLQTELVAIIDKTEIPRHELSQQFMHLILPPIEQAAS
jgi:hypothetical protein